jgi:hypothetical protein
MKLSTSEKLIVGTHANIDNQIVYEAIKKKLFFHTSIDYPGYQRLYKAVNSVNKKVNLIVKIKSKNLANLKKQIRIYLKDFRNIDKLSIQISRMCFPQNKNKRRLYFDYLRKLKNKGVVHDIYLEIYWEYSAEVISLIKEIKFDGFCICYNIIEREVSNKLLDLLIKNKYKIISLRGLSGNNLRKDNKSVLHISYFKFVLIFFFIFILKKLSKKDHIKLSLDYLILNKEIYKTVIRMSKIENFYDNINYSTNIRRFYIVNLINFFHNLIWRFSGANSPSSSKFKLGLYIRVENFLVKKLINFISKFLNLLNISLFFLIKKNIVYLNSSSQIINLCELIKKKKIDISKTLILYGLGPSKYIHRLKFVNTLNILKIKNYRLIEIFIGERLLFLIILIFFFIKKYDYVIIGNLFTDFSNYLTKLKSKFKYVLDDGTSTLYLDKFLKYNSLKSKIFNNIYIKKNENIFLFTYFDIKISRLISVKNNFYNLHKKFLADKKKIGTYILILGNAYPNKNIMSRKSYYKIILKIKKKFPINKIRFIKHPLEFDDIKLDNFLIENKIDVVIHSNYPAEVQVLLFNKLPRYIISINSSSLFALGEILKKFKNIHIFNLRINKNILTSHQEKIDIISKYRTSTVKRMIL